MKRLLWLLLALLGGAGCRSRQGPAPHLALPAPDPQGVYPFSANALFSLYETDGKEADRLLRGKIVLVTGWVEWEHSGIEPDPERLKKGERTPPDLFLHVAHQSNGFFIPVGGIICNFPEDARPVLRTLLKKRDTREAVTVRGTVGGKLGSVFLESCALEKMP